MPTTLKLTVTVRCGHCDHILSEYEIDPAERPSTESKYHWQHLSCSSCHKTMGPKIAITDSVIDPA